MNECVHFDSPTSNCLSKVTSWFLFFGGWPYIGEARGFLVFCVWYEVVALTVASLCVLSVVRTDEKKRNIVTRTQQGQQGQQRLPGLVTQFVTLPLRSEPMQRDQHASVTRADAHGNIPSTVLGTVGFCFTTSSVEAIHQPSRAWSGKKQYRSYKHVVQLTQSQRDRGERRKEK